MRALVLVIGVHILLLLAGQFIAWPENLAWPYLNAHGLAFYRDIFVPYPPLYWQLLTAWYRIFGISVFSLQIYSYAVIALTDAILFLAAGRGLLPVIIYVPLQIFFEGNGLWVDALLAPLFLLAYVSFKAKRYFWVGVLLGLSLLVKQTAIYVIPVFLAAILLSGRQKKITSSLARAAAGFAIPMTAAIIYLFINRAVEPFIDEAVRYILAWHAQYPLQKQAPSLGQALICAVVFLPAIINGIKNKRVLLTALTIFAAMGIFTRFEYFHLQPALPFAAILLTSGVFSAGALAVFFLVFLRQLHGVWLAPPLFYDARMLANAQQIGKYVKPEERTLFINTWDHYYFLTKTLPAGNIFVPSAPWTFDYDGVQDKYIEVLKSAKPNFVFVGKCFLTRGICYRPTKITAFISGHYSQVGELTDGTGVFQYLPVAVAKKIKTSDR